MASSRTDNAPPSSDELRAYNDGRLGTERFEAVDRWIAAQDPATQERILSGGEASGALAAAAEVVPRTGDTPFSPDLGPGGRFRKDCPIGAGGMGIVELVKDRVLARDVVIKRCRPRRPNESVAAYARRQQLFKREAQLTAQLEHPGIVPVHDVGVGPLGEPAFAMKRLEGEPMSAIIAQRRAGAAIDVPRLVETILRVADAVGYAHSRGIVHRDLKPENIIVGQLGAVYVIDWGLAGTIGTVPTVDPGSSPNGSVSGSGMGTPAWMAPEQFGQVKADPRMDVFALGGLLMATLTGRGPRDRGVAPGSPEVNLQPLDARLPRGLVAVARRCLEIDPKARYLDATAVADDLRQWLARGLTSAENPGRLTRVLNALRRSRKLSAALIGAAAAAICLAGGLAWSDYQTRARLRAEVVDLAAHRPTDLQGLTEARARLQRIMRRYPSLVSAQEVEDSFAKQVDYLEKQKRGGELYEELRTQLAKVKVLGTWPSEIAELTAMLKDWGLSIDPPRLDADAQVIADAGPRREDLLTALAYLQRAYAVDLVASPVSSYIPRLIDAAAADPAWRAMAALLVDPELDGHDLAMPDRPRALADVSTNRRTADLVLTLFAPDHPPRDPAEAEEPSRPSLLPLIQARLREQRNDFWANVAAARAALLQRDWSTVEAHASVAVGSGTERLGDEPKQSVWPLMLLAYARLGRIGSDEHADWSDVLALAVEAWEINPHHAELIALRAAGMGALGSGAEAQDLMNRSGAGALLRWHLHHETGHPIEMAIKALVSEGIEIPAADPQFGPLAVPGAP